MWVALVVPVRRLTDVAHQLGDGPERVEAEPGELRAHAGLAAARHDHLPLPAQTERALVPQGAPTPQRRPTVSDRRFFLFRGIRDESHQVIP